jgi:RNA polymerase sigma-70 factor (ECF subfamily)
MDPSDTTLLAEVRAGNEQALAKLLERYAPAVYRFGAKMCRNPEDARDVMQETLLAAARGLREFRGGASLSTWLFTIARSFCIKARRQRAGAPSEGAVLGDDAAGQVPATDQAPDQILEQRELGAAIDAAIASLDPVYREVLVLRDVEGLTAREVAQVLGVGVDAVKSRLHRARVAVRDRIAPLLAPAEPSGPPGCPDVLPVLSQYLEGEIGPTQCAEMDRHVAQCPRCRARCDSLRNTLALCRSSAQGSAVPLDVQEAVRNALRGIAAGSKPPSRGHGAGPPVS